MTLLVVFIYARLISTNITPTYIWLFISNIRLLSPNKYYYNKMRLLIPNLY